MSDIKLVKNGQVDLSKTKRLIRKPKLPMIDLNEPINFINIKHNNKIYECAVSGVDITQNSYDYSSSYCETTITINVRIIEEKPF